MAEASVRDTVPFPAQPVQTPPVLVRKGATEDLFDRLQMRWEELKDRIANPTALNRPSFMRELRDDAEYVRLRARYYHQDRPLHAVGMVAGAAFVIGLLVGFGRR